jgi:hypothetical protein
MKASNNSTRRQSPQGRLMTPSASVTKSAVNKSGYEVLSMNNIISQSVKGSYRPNTGSQLDYTKQSMIIHSTTK